MEIVQSRRKLDTNYYKSEYRCNDLSVAVSKLQLKIDTRVCTFLVATIVVTFGISEDLLKKRKMEK